MTVPVPMRLACHRAGIAPRDMRIPVLTVERVGSRGIIGEPDKPCSLLRIKTAGGTTAGGTDPCLDIGDKLPDTACRLLRLQILAVTRIPLPECEREQHVASRAARRIQIHDLCHRTGRQIGGVIHDSA